MNFKRRDFLKLTGFATAGLTLSSVSSYILPGCSAAGGNDSRAFGLQLYGIRDIIGKDPKGVLQKVAAAGYRQIELFEQKTLGLYLGMSNTELKKFTEDLGMTVPSIHTNVFKDYEKKVEEAAAIGVKYIIYNWEGPGKKLDDYKKFADDFNTMGEFADKHNIRFAFHNHDFSFMEMEGMIPQQWMMDHTDKNLVDYQIDIYWVIAAGQDPVKWINKYPDRFKLAHFKDRTKGATEREGKAICELGTGSIDFPSILKQIKGSSIKYYIVDQDTCNDGPDPLACIVADAEYMKKLKW